MEAISIALACDHGGYNLKEAIAKHLLEQNIPFKDFGTYSTASVDYPVYAKKVCYALQNNEFTFGILCCGTGIGMSMVANKQKGIRAAVLSDPFSAEMTRRHNNANVLCLGGRVIDSETAIHLVDIFIHTPFEGGRHQKRIDQFE